MSTQPSTDQWATQDFKWGGPTPIINGWGASVFVAYFYGEAAHSVFLDIFCFAGLFIVWCLVCKHAWRLEQFRRESISEKERGRA